MSDKSVPRLSALAERVTQQAQAAGTAVHNSDSRLDSTLLDTAYHDSALGSQCGRTQ